MEPIRLKVGEQYHTTISRHITMDEVDKIIYVDENRFVHNDFGPALIGRMYPHSNIIATKYYNHGKLHRLDGPAVIFSDPSNDSNESFDSDNHRFHINGVMYTRKDYYSIINNTDKENLEEVVSLRELF